jgi:hypothetical protein
MDSFKIFRVNFRNFDVPYAGNIEKFAHKNRWNFQKLSMEQHSLLEMIERAVEDVRVEAKTGVDQRGKLTANLGAQWALEELRDSLIQYRFNALLEMRRQQSMFSVE